MEAKDREILQDSVHAEALIRGLAGNGVTDEALQPLLPLLMQALRSAPDPDRAMAAFARWFGALGSPTLYLQLLLQNPALLQRFCLVTGSSQLFAALLGNQPEQFEIIAYPGPRGGTRPAAAYLREIRTLLAACRRPELKTEALRRWKAAAMLRTGVRDLLGLADMPSTAREFSNLADACVQAALDIAHAALPAQMHPPFTVIGMGKLGGQELNYSSDIDLMFLHADNLPDHVVMEDGREWEMGRYLNRLAETLTRTLAESGPGGSVFRVDLRLRPEGRFGPLVRSLESYAAYYESWAEGWERQALIKARPVAGDAALGEAFLTLIAPFVYTSPPSAALMEEITENKRRIEQKCAIQGQSFLNIKTGEGSIRDIEFVVQRLQLLHGGAMRRLRVTNTLAALQRLRQTHLLAEQDALELADDLIFLRNLEHRLQLLHGHQTQTLPPPENELEWNYLARRMGFGSSGEFTRQLQMRRARVQHALQRLFYQGAPEHTAELAESAWQRVRTLLETGDTPQAGRELKDRLAQAGFLEPDRALQSLLLPVYGNQFGAAPPESARRFSALAPRLIETASMSPDPDCALAGFEALAQGGPNPASFYAACHDSPDMLERLLMLAGAAPPLVQLLVRHPEWLEGLINPEEDEETPAPVPDAAGGDWLNALARWQQRRLLHTAAWDIWDEPTVQQVQQKLTETAAQILQRLLQGTALQHPHAQALALIGMGKLGGGEIGYGSDWDALLAYYPHRLPENGELQRAAEYLLQLARRFQELGGTAMLDLRLRPWGGDGALAQTPRAIAAYFRQGAEMWERQAALKAGFVAGCERTAARTVQILRAVSCGQGITQEQEMQIAQMKVRMEKERLKPQEKLRNLKLGHGGLTDIEWMVQYSQMRYAPQHPALCTSSTLQALQELEKAGKTGGTESRFLIESWCTLSMLRNRIRLYSGSSADVLPETPRALRAIARQLGFADHDQQAAYRMTQEMEGRMREVRTLFLRCFGFAQSLFYANHTD